jgi:tetratricopeptide (TPR) repeat protein
MLLDLTSHGRKRVVRVVFGFLALIFASSFIFLGIGTEGGFNPLDSLFGADNNSTADAFEQQIEDAETAVEESPDDPKALSELVLLRAQSAASQLDVDEETGQSSLTEESRSEYEEAVSVWQTYLDTEPRKVDSATARAAVSAYQSLNDINGVIDAQERLAESDPDGTTYGFLATFLYLDLQIEKADKARDKAVAESNAKTGKLIEKQLATYRKQAVKTKKAEAKLPKSEQGQNAELEDPFGGLSPTAPGGGLDPGGLPTP